MEVWDADVSESRIHVARDQNGVLNPSADKEIVQKVIVKKKTQPKG